MELVDNGDLSIERASKKAGMTIEEFRKQIGVMQHFSNMI